MFCQFRDGARLMEFNGWMETVDDAGRLDGVMLLWKTTLGEWEGAE